MLVGNTVNAAGLDGFVLVSAAQGGASFICNTVTNLASGQLAYANKASGFLAIGSCNNGFTVPSALATPNLMPSLSSASIMATQSSAPRPSTLTPVLRSATAEPLPFFQV